MACAQTGSGKTAAFLVPILSRCLTERLAVSSSNSYRAAACPVALILAPTRELCGQIYDEVCKVSFVVMDF